MIYNDKYLKLLIFLNAFILKLLFLNDLAVSQNVPVPDDTLGNENSRVAPFTGDNSIDIVTGGATRGSNLFHSFREFNVDVGRSVYFFAPNAEIQNILARVTGGNRSEILGTLGTRLFDGSSISNSNANLFLINPNGILFGEGARLDVGGSFTATTANAVEFGEEGVFSATNPQSPSQLLTVNPSALLFNQIASQPGNIVNRGNLTRVKDLTLAADNLDLQGQLVAENLQLQANNAIEISNARSLSRKTNISSNYLTITDSNSIGVIATEENTGSISIKVDDFVKLDNSFIESLTTGNNIGNGDISIEANSIYLSDNSQIITAVSGSGEAGDIFIKAENVSLVGNPTNLSSTLITSRLGRRGIGKSGDINIETDSLSLSGGQISASTFGEGNAGNIIIQANNSFSLLNQSNIFSGVESGARGNGGEINIKTGSFSSKDGSQLLAIVRGASINNPTPGRGNAGNINLEVRDTATISGKLIGIDSLTGANRIIGGIATAIDQGASGNAGSITIKADELFLTDFAGIASSLDRGATGNAGNINIKVGSLFLNNKAQIGSPTVGNGNAGQVFLKADNSISLDNSLISSSVEQGAEGNGGDINIKAGSLSLSKGAQLLTLVRGDLGNLDGGKGNAGNINIDVRDTITLDGTARGIRGGIVRSGIGTSVRPGAAGASGDINIQAGTLLIENGASLDSSTTAEQKAGDININLRNFLTVQNGDITTTSEQSSGGIINITAKNIQLFDDSNIRTDVDDGTGEGGDINLKANTIVALDDSDILSFSADGKGGNITFNTAGFFSNPLYKPTSPIRDRQVLSQLNTNQQVDVNASGAVSGTITGIPDTTFIQDSLTDLPNNQIDPNTLIANSCINRTANQNNTFFITGKGGIPIRPDDAPLPNYSTGSIRSLGTTNTRPRWKTGDPIVEPTGVYKLPNGKLVLSRECS